MNSEGACHGSAWQANFYGTPYFSEHSSFPALLATVVGGGGLGDRRKVVLSGEYTSMRICGAGDVIDGWKEKQGGFGLLWVITILNVYFRYMADD